MHYLDMCRRYCSIFLDETTFSETVQSASYVTNFLRLWRNSIKASRKYTTERNFISIQCYTDIVLSCHFVVHILRTFRDIAPNSRVELGLTGSDVCESFFSENGSFVMNRHTYSFRDMLLNTEKMSHLNTIAARGLVQLNKAHTKQEIVWKTTASITEGERNGKHVPDDRTLSTLWERGLVEAQEIWSSHSMDITTDAFKVPEQFDLGNSVPSDEEDVDTDAGSSAHSSADEAGECEIAVVESQLRQAMTDDETDYSATERPANHSLTINVPGVGSVYKSTVISLMNSGGQLSKDRLTRVQQHNVTTMTTTSDQLGDDELALFSDIIYKHCSSYKFGRVIRMFIEQPRRVDYVKPVSFTQTDLHTKLQLVVRNYEKLDADDNDSPYQYTSKELIIQMKSVISICSLDFNSESKFYSASENLLAAMAALSKPKPSNSSRHTYSASTTRNADEADAFGMVSTVVPPAPGARSQRHRNVRVFLD